MGQLLRWVLFLVGVSAAVPAIGAPCAGFSDVDDANPATASFCGDVAWIKNRSVTLGCTSATEYCPTAPVSRLAMAAFMRRLGAALIPESLMSNQLYGSLPLLSGLYLCVTPPSDSRMYDRRIDINSHVDFSLNSGPAQLLVEPVYSLDDGATWSSTNLIAHTVFAPAGTGNGSPAAMSVSAPAGTTVRAALFVSRPGGAVYDLEYASCLVRATVSSAP